MNALDKLNEAINYIEDHLEDDLDYKQLTRLAHCSDYHFRRMFSFLAGISVSEYVRRRRLTSAARELKEDNKTIMDIAVKYGYTSSDAFSRAFESLHGILPSEARQSEAHIKAFPRLSFQLIIRGGTEMNYRIIEKEAFRLVGFKKRVPIIFEGINPEIAEMNTLLTDEVVSELKEWSDTEPQGIISASTNFSEERMEGKGYLDHYIGVATTQSEVKDYTILDIPAGTWVVFEAVGTFPETLQDVWGRIYSEWFPGSGYEAVEGPEILWNEGADTSKSDYRSEIWIPVKKTDN